MPDSNTLTWVERNGSFGLVVVIVLAALAGGVLFLRYLKNELVPGVLRYLDERDARESAERAARDARFTAALNAREETCREAVQTSAKAAAAVESLSGSVSDLASEVKKLKDRTDEHRPVRGRRDPD